MTHRCYIVLDIGLIASYYLGEPLCLIETENMLFTIHKIFKYGQQNISIDCFRSKHEYLDLGI